MAKTEKNIFIDYLRELPNFLSILMFSFFFSIASPILLEISQSIGTDPGRLSLIFTFFAIGIMIGQLTSVLYNIKFKRIYILLTSYILLIPIVITMSLSNHLHIFYFLYFVSGYLIGVIWIQANDDVLDSKIKNKNKLFNTALIFFPLGNLTAPLVSSAIVANKLNWRLIYYVIIFLILVIILLYLKSSKKKKSKDLIEEKTKIYFKNTFTNRRNNVLFILITITVLFYGISETVVVTWSPTFFRIERMFDAYSAGLVVSIFWIAIIFGRIFTSFLSGKIKTFYIIFTLSIIAFFSLILMILSNTRYSIFIAAGFAGLGFSAIISLLIFTGSSIYKSSRTLLLSILFASAGLGGSIAPNLTLFASQSSMRLSIFMSVIPMGIVSFLLIVNIFYKKRFIDK